MSYILVSATCDLQPAVQLPVEHVEQANLVNILLHPKRSSSIGPELAKRTEDGNGVKFETSKIGSNGDHILASSPAVIENSTLNSNLLLKNNVEDIHLTTLPTSSKLNENVAISSRKRPYENDNTFANNGSEKENGKHKSPKN